MKDRFKIIFAILAISFFLMEVFASATIMRSNKFEEKNINKKVFAKENTIGREILIPKLNEIPSQKEALSEPPPDDPPGSVVNISDMVNPYSGDFNYTIPILVIPGPDGGFPLNLSYSTGSSMEQAASWVGLGWDLNPGIITRDVRGLPDDCNGDIVKKQMKMKPDRTYSLSCSPPMAGFEILGQNVSFSEYQFYYNNYTGAGFKIGLHNLADEANNNFLHPDNTYSYSTQEGLDFEKKIGINTKIKDLESDFSLSYNSRKGLTDLSLNTNYDCGKSGYLGVGVPLFGYARKCFAPNVNFPIVSGSALLAVKFGGEGAGIFENTTVRGMYMEQSLNSAHNHTRSIPGYGYMYSQNRDNIVDKDNIALMDFSRESEIVVNKTCPALPAPVFTNDLYFISGDADQDKFQAFRSDIGVLFDEGMSGHDLSGELGLDLGLGTGAVKIGLIGGVMYTNVYSGLWRNNRSEFDDFFFKMPSLVHNELFEPYYLKSLNENTSQLYDDGTDNRFGGLNPIKFKISRHCTDFITFKPLVHNATDNVNTILGYNQQKDREKRVSSITPITIKKLRYGFPFDNNPLVSSSTTSFPPTLTTQFNYSTTGLSDDMIGKIIKTNSQGYRYEYGIPVVTEDKSEVLFSVSKQTNINSLVTSSGGYDITDASVDNDEGIDEFYSKTTLPNHAQSYLITAIYSPDYVDVSDNGPSEDDLGDYTKFNYTYLGKANFRSPCINAMYLKGFYSNDFDDKAAYNSENDDIYYVNSIETKTHIAKFYIEDRCDGYTTTSLEVNNDNSNYTQSSLKRLDKIELYSKADLTTPIKTIHFKYDYELCAGYPMNRGGSSCNNNDNDGGKLTLKEVWFTYGTNERGALSPYKFEYNTEYTYSGNTYQYNYNTIMVDRWGTYKPDVTSENPYTMQDNKALLDDYSKAWSLSSIQLPSGGKINVDYESDDYAYVQADRAMQMCEITSLSGNGVYFKLKEPIAVSDPDAMTKLYEYIKGIKYLYFKVYLKLTHDYSDYVEGYSEIDFNNYHFETPGVGQNYYTSAYVDLKPSTLTLMEIPSISKAGMDYLKIKRPDIVYPGVNVDKPLTQVLNILTTMYHDFGSMYFGFYSFCIINNFCVQMDNGYKSYIRLNSPDYCKFGGGSRVKEITYDDTWAGESNSFTYGQTFEYKTKDGKSSGVAEYEPLSGGDEIALRLPYWYKTDQFHIQSYRNPAVYLEFPLTESYFPSPKVGYSRIIVKNIKNEISGVEENSKTASGTSVYDYYTSRDFPVTYDYTGLTKKPYYQKTIIPFIGSNEFKSNGYSQGYKVELNDMPGKIKSISTYPHNADINSISSQPVEKVLYNYFTENSVLREDSNKLSSTVLVMNGDRNFRTGKLGENIEFFTELSQHSSFTEYLSISGDADIQLPFFFMPSLTYMNYTTDNDFRTVTSNKIIHRNGILKEIKQFHNSGSITTKNLAYDAETGLPVFSTITNNFDSLVYSYNYPAHWNYENMGGAYKNIGELLNGTFSSGVFHINDNLLNISDNFSLGDEVIIDDGSPVYYVTDIDASNANLELKDEENVSPTISGSHNILIIRSGRRNLQGVNSGTIISLASINATASPIDFPLFDELNEKLETTDPPFQMDAIVDCATGNRFTPYCDINGEEARTENQEITEITFTYHTGEDNVCSIKIQLIPFPQHLTSLIGLKFVKKGNIVFVYDGENVVAIGFWSSEGDCYNSECMDNVLHADAATFKDDFGYNITDAGSVSPFSSNILNPYKLGTKGIWNPENSYLFQIRRKQTNGSLTLYQPDIENDGMYKNFVLFDWDISNHFANTEWTKVSEVKQYSPSGNVIETKDVLGRFSSVLYGYDNTQLNYSKTQITATGTLAEYREIAFDGFEDYESLTPSHLDHGHFTFTTSSSGGFLLSDANSHTGKKSLQVNAGDYVQHLTSAVPLSIASVYDNDYTPTELTKYILSAWVKTANGTPEITVTCGSANFSQILVGEKIDGWQKIEVVFTTSATGTNNVNVKIKANNDVCYFDDIRIQPFVSTMVTSVYDPKKLWKIAELDDNNYATFYNYDEEGNLVLVKKETENGIITVSTTRTNIK